MDASLIPVPTQRNTREENATITAGDCPADWAAQLAKRRQKDTEARWAVKHGVSHYGYKKHVNMEKQHKLIRQYTVTDAAVHDSHVLEEVLLAQTDGRAFVLVSNMSLAITSWRWEGGGADSDHCRGRARAKIGLKNLTYKCQRFLVLRGPAERQTA